MGSGLALAGLMPARSAGQRSRRFSWDQKRLLVTGGSTGLGLAIAKQLASKGVRLAICALTTEQLKGALSELQGGGAHVIGIKCDLRDGDSTKRMYAEIEGEYGGVDVLFNVEGVIDVGLLDLMTPVEFENSIQTNCWGALRAIQATLPGMRQRGWGRIMNIASFGPQRAEPYIWPYAASRFALVELSTGLRAELRHENIVVSTARPGLMNSGSAGKSMFSGKHGEEYAWFSIDESLPLMSRNVEEAASRIIESCQHGRGELLAANPPNFAVNMQKCFPPLKIDMLALMDQRLPGMGGIGREAIRENESRSKSPPSVFTELRERAVVANNEL